MSACSVNSVIDLTADSPPRPAAAAAQVQRPALRVGFAEGSHALLHKPPDLDAARRMQFFFEVTVRPGCTFAQLDSFIRSNLDKDGHLSQFRVLHRGTTIAADDEFDDGLSGKPASTRVCSVMSQPSGAVVVWEFDFGSPSYTALVALGEVSGDAGGPPVSEHAAPTAAPPAASSSAAGGATFDKVFPQIAHHAINDGGFAIGKGCDPYNAASCVNCGGNVGDVGLEGFHGTIDDALRALEFSCARTYHLRDLEISSADVASQAECDAYSFAARYPKITKHVSFGRMKRSVQVGTAWGGPFVKASKGDSWGGRGSAVWQGRPGSARYGHSVETALDEMERALP